MREFGIRHIPVVESGKMAGIVSDGDILLASTLREGRIDVPERPVSSIMSRNVVTCFPTSSLRDIAAAMIRLQISCIPVVIDQRILGIVTSTDLLRIIASHPEAVGMGNGSGIDLDALRSA
ncbi:CBS domain-containing protein [bacterium]|nr:CBS domain-containing protein [bacterium]